MFSSFSKNFFVIINCLVLSILNKIFIIEFVFKNWLFEGVFWVFWNRNQNIPNNPTISYVKSLGTENEKVQKEKIELSGIMRIFFKVDILAECLRKVWCWSSSIPSFSNDRTPVGDCLLN